MEFADFATLRRLLIARPHGSAGLGLALTGVYEEEDYVIVDDVTPGGVAAAAGLQPGMVVIEVDDRLVFTEDDGTAPATRH